MKKILQIIITISLLIGFISISNAVDLDTNLGKITESSIKTIQHSGDIVNDINHTGKNILTNIKVIIQGILIIFIVYIGAQMMMSLGKNEDDLTKAKTQIRYALIGFVFINIPGTLYNAFTGGNPNSLGGRFIGSSWQTEPVNDNNLFINMYNFGTTLNSNIIGFIEVALVGIAILMITLSGIKIISSRGKEDVVTNEKEKIAWSLIALMFVGFISAWKSLAFSGNISDGVNIFETISNLALFFAGPVAIFFLTLSGYYYITSNGDEEKVKKAKNIIINVVIGTIILLASYSFLLDLATF